MQTKVYEEISHEELSALTNAIKTKYGIDFTNYEQKSLRRGFAKLISKFEMNSLVDLWSKILQDREFFKSIIDDLTVNLTELFRNPEIWRTIREDVLPVVNKNKEVKIWHAGCSTGEEVYSMTTVLHQSLMLYKTKILATDLSNRVLEKAKQGRYPKVLMNKYEKGLLSSFPDASFEDIFLIEEDHVYIKERFKKPIEFKKHNLVQDSVFDTYEIIFCRNVMIYFDETLKMNVLKRFHKALKPEGYFIIGYYDMLPSDSKELFELYDATTRIYKKIG